MNFSIPVKRQSSLEWVQSLNQDDRYYLEAFLRHLVCEDLFGYVLYGEKPVVISVCTKPKLVGLCFGLFPERTIFTKGYEIFCRLHKAYPLNKKYALLIDQHNDWADITFINKQSFFKVVEQNIKEFKEALGSEVTPENLLTKIVSQKCSVSESLADHHGLLGILLGYGKNNSFLFCKRVILKEKISSFSLCPTSFHGKDQELQDLDSQLTGFGDKFVSVIKMMPLPQFVADQSTQETKDLYVNYLSQRKDITNIYKDGNFLEITLTCLYPSSQ